MLIKSHNDCPKCIDNSIGHFECLFLVVAHNSVMIMTFITLLFLKESDLLASSTEQKIIDVTIGMIQQSGYQDISLRKVAISAGLTTGAIYTHFKNKEALFYKTSLQIHDSIKDRFDLDGSQSAFQRLDQVAQTLCQLFQTEPRVMEFIYFNPILVKAYQSHATDFPFIKLTRSLSDQANPGTLSDEQFFHQTWSFIQGYGLLIKDGLAKYDANLVSVTIQQLCQPASSSK